MTKFEQYKQRKQHEYGAKFDPSDLAEQFTRYYNTGERIEVEFVGQDGEVYETKRGRVGVTTGWKPIFLLVLTKRSMGSSYTLRAKDRVKLVVAA